MINMKLKNMKKMKIKRYKSRTTAELISSLTTLKTNKVKLDEIFGKLEEITGGEYDTPIHNAAYMTFDHACELLCESYKSDFNITLDDLCWFVHENKFGDAGLEYDDDGTIVNDIDSFIQAIESNKGE